MMDDLFIDGVEPPEGPEETLDVLRDIADELADERGDLYHTLHLSADSVTVEERDGETVLVEDEDQEPMPLDESDALVYSVGFAAGALLTEAGHQADDTDLL